MPMTTNEETGLPQFDHEIDPEQDEIAALKERNAALTQCIHMLNSALKGGEQWSETLQKEVDQALGAAPPEAPAA
jgi:uncharacterized phage infection (PIP) family protein YhgE